ncbi:hypothetical protein N665_0279s0038 [Sinapis alba]|nr:hypothetical protein N665_0279s0038 [Sinapis alba]
MAQTMRIVMVVMMFLVTMECGNGMDTKDHRTEKEEDHRVCFKNCLEKCRIDDYACQLKCERDCPSTPPALSKYVT